MKKDINSNSRGYEIEIKDLLARLFDKWVIILICILIGAAIGYLIGYTENKKQETRMVSQEDVDKAGQYLSAEDVQNVENLYYQYCSYQAYCDSLEKYLSESRYSDNEFENSIILTSVYYIDSSVVTSAARVLQTLSLDVTDCEKIAQILHMESINLDDIYRRVNISGVGETYNTELIGGTVEKPNLIQTGSQSDTGDDQLLQIWTIADTKEQAEGIIKVVEESFERSLEGLKQIDSEITLIPIGQKYSADVYAFLSDRQSDYVEDLQNANYQVFRLKEQYIEELGSIERNYFDLLEARDKQTIIPASMKSLKKLLLLGIVIGLIIGCVLVILQYLLNGRLKTARELAERYDVEVPVVVYRKQKRFRLFGCIIRKLTSADFSDEAILRRMAASDIVIKLEKNEYQSVCLISDNITDAEEELVRDIAAGIKEKDDRIDVRILNPLSGVEELEAFSSSDAVILVTQLKKTHLNIVNKWKQLCARYDLPIAGAIALEEC